jgi:Tfp pilus assembly protein PilV
MMARLLHRLRSETGTSMVEVLAAAVILVVISGALISLVTGAQRESGSNRVIAVAGDLAQSELEQLRAKRFSDLTELKVAQVDTVTAGGIKYEVTRQSEWASANSEKSGSCSGAASTPSALKVTVSVDWPDNANKPLQLDTLVAAPIAEETTGNFVVQVNDRAGDGVAAVPVTMQGPETVAGQTDDTGCVRFNELTAGNYTVKVQKLGYVDVNHQNLTTKAVTVTKNDTGSASFEYDRGGRVWLRFWRQDGGGTNPPKTPAPVAGARFVGQANTVPGAVSGTNNSEVRQPYLMWPQTAPYAVFSDSCLIDNTSIADAPVTPGGDPQTPIDITLPRVRLEIRQLPAGFPANQIWVRTTSACDTVQPEFSGTFQTVDGQTNVWVGTAAMPPGTLKMMCAYSRMQYQGRWYWKRYSGVTLDRNDTWPGETKRETLDFNGAVSSSTRQADQCTS